MKRVLFGFACLLLMWGLVVPTPVMAADKVVYWLSVGGGYSTYSMSDVNNEVRALGNAPGSSFGEIEDGWSFGGEAGLTLHGGVALGLGYERTTGSAQVVRTDVVVDYDLPANLFYGTVQYMIPPLQSLHLGLAGLLGLVSASGTVTLTGGGSPGSGDISGTGLLAEARLLGEYEIGGRFAVVPSVGYRFAKIGSVTVNGLTAYNEDGSKEAIDYSGLTLRLALRLFLN